MAHIWGCGFEINAVTNNIELTAFQGSPTIQTTTKRSGARALQINAMGSGSVKGCRHTFLSAAGNGPYFFQVCYNVATLPSAENTIFQLNDTAAFTTPVVRVTIDNGGLLRLYDEDGQIGSASSAITLNADFVLEVQFDRTAAAGSHVVRARLDLVEFAGASNRDLSAGLVSFNAGGNLNSEAQTTGNWFVDDMVINDSSSSFQNSYPGGVHLFHMLSNAAGANAGFSRGGADSGANWSQVEENPPNDATDYVTSNTLNVTDDYNMDATPAEMDSGDTVSFVAIWARCAVSDATGSDPAIKLRFTAGGNTEEQSDAINVNSTTWFTNLNGTPINPRLILYDLPGASTTGITKSDLDSAQIGMRVSTGDTHSAQVTAIWAQVGYLPVSAQSADVGLASETDAAQAVGKSKQRSVGLSSEADTAQTLGAARSISIGLASETDLAQTIAHIKQLAIGLASETDAAQALTRIKQLVAGLASEVDTAQAIAGQKTKAIGQATETDLAQALTALKQLAIGLASESDTAQAAAWQKIKAVGLASELDEAQAVGTANTIPVGVAAETDAASLISKIKQQILGLVSESDLAQAVTRIKQRVISFAVETDQAMPITSFAPSGAHRNRQLLPLANTLSPLGS